MKKEIKLTKKSFLGYILIMVGLVLLTSPLVLRSYHDFMAKSERMSFEKIQASKTDAEIAEENKNAQTYNEMIKGTDPSVEDPFTSKDYENRYEMFRTTNTPFAYLSIPKLDKYLPLYLDATYEHIAKGVAQVAGTAIPVGGKGTRSAIAGHRGWWGDTMFLYVDELKNGDYIYIERANQTMRYVVSDKEIIGPYDWDKLAPRGDLDMITLLTCSPFLPPRPNRLLVNAIRDESGPAEEFKLPSGDFVASANDASKGNILVKIMKIATLIGAVIGILAIVYTGLRFVKRLKAGFC
ncbi:sortase family protein [Anaerococcus lactolyticus ATCC 51172]|uniref:Sortase family protein n=2 Tax=Anaerococcus lactolyticus TaxID=33032 RepID=C2BEL6_9FIRM|nr:sortase family protein [Anaerococcus lactolyticus ATCC 51172]